MPQVFVHPAQLTVGFRKGIALEYSKSSGRSAWNGTTNSKVLTGASVRWMEPWRERRLEGKKRGPNPTDRAKQGTKRRVLTEGGGVPIGITVDGANRNDFKMTKETLTGIPIKRPKPTKKKRQGMCLDKGYDFDEVRRLLRRFHFVPPIRSGGEEAQRRKKNPRWKARRWVVERTYSWMNRFRVILICWTKKQENFLAQLHLACAYITLGQCGLLG